MLSNCSGEMYHPKSDNVPLASCSSWTASNDMKSFCNLLVVIEDAYAGGDVKGKCLSSAGSKAMTLSSRRFRFVGFRGSIGSASSVSCRTPTSSSNVATLHVSNSSSFVPENSAESCFVSTGLRDLGTAVIGSTNGLCIKPSGMRAGS